MDKKGNILLGAGIVLLVILGIVLIIAMILGGTYNHLVKLDTDVENNWARVETAYQRRFDLIPNLVATVKAYSDYEGETLKEVIEARSAWAGAASSTEKVEAAASMESALARLMVVVESYPDLKANQGFIDLQAELAGTENRIKWERDEFNSAVADYKKSVRSFPTNMLAGMFGFYPDKWKMFESKPGAENSPNVKTLFD